VVTIVVEVLIGNLKGSEWVNGFVAQFVVLIWELIYLWSKTKQFSDPSIINHLKINKNRLYLIPCS
jgi:hypothetical protein